MLRSRWTDSRKRITIIFNIFPPGVDRSRVSFGAWQEWPERTLGRLVYVPHVWLKPGDVIPTCPDCSTPFKKTLEYPSMVGYEANCVDKHDPELLGTSCTPTR